tara:strand:+ start:515 stop:823 length:309 start_codon:yes stop_codon:yes gene_type:complete
MTLVVFEDLTLKELRVQLAKTNASLDHGQAMARNWVKLQLGEAETADGFGDMLHALVEEDIDGIVAQGPGVKMILCQSSRMMLVSLYRDELQAEILKQENAS